MKKRWMAGLLAAVMALTSAGCGSSSESGSESAAAFTPSLDTEAEISFSIIGVMQNFESLEAIISDFAAYYPNADIVYTAATSTEEYWTVLSSRLVSDDSVGLFMMQDKHYDSTKIAEMCVDLSQEDLDLSAIQPEAISSSTVDGKLYGLPLMHNATGMIVNKTLLAEQGVEIPTNYSEFLAACETLKAAGYTPVQGYAGSVNENFLHAMGYVLMNNEFGGESGVSMDNLLAGEEGSAALLQPAFDALDTMYQNGYIDPDVNAAIADSYNETILSFFEGDVPFMVGTAETFSGTKKRESKSEHFTAEPFEYAFMTIPLAEDGAYSFVENWYSFSMNENCANREDVLEFLRFLATKEEINEMAYVKGMPSVAVETDDDRFIGLYSEQEDLYCTNDTYFPSDVQDALWAAEMDLAEGRITVDQATSEVERRIRESDYEVETSK